MKPEILRTPQVLELIPISRATLWRRVQSGQFPTPLRLGGPDSRAVGWRRTDIEEWVRNLLAA